MTQIPLYRQGDGTIAQLLMRQGDIAAERAARSGQIWGNAISGVGQAVAQGVQGWQQQKDMEKRRVMFDEALASFDPQNPTAFYRSAVTAYGPEIANSALRAMAALQESQRKAEPDPKLLETKAKFVADMWKTDPDWVRKNWSTVSRGLAEAEPLYGVPVGPDWDEKQYGPVLTALQTGEPLQRVETKNADGSTTITWARPKEGQTFTSAAPPAKPENLSGEEAFIRARYGATPTPEQMLAGRAAYAGAGRAPEKPEAPKEYVFNPEGVVLSSYGMRERDSVRTQAMERGLPVFETAASQQKGITLAGIVADAKELQDLMSLDKVKDAIGAFSGRFTQLKAKVFDLDPDVQRAVQLMTSLSDTELRKRSGAQINDKEMQRLLRFTTDPNKTVGHNVTAVRGLLGSASRDYRALSGVDLGVPEGARASEAVTKQDFFKRHGL